MNWSPTDAELESLNALRRIYGLPPVSGITTAEQWWNACDEVDTSSNAEGEG